MASDTWPTPSPAKTLERYDAALSAFDDATKSLRAIDLGSVPAELRLRHQTSGVVWNVLSAADLLRDLHGVAMVVSEAHFAFMRSLPPVSGPVPDAFIPDFKASTRLYFKHTGHLNACFQAVLLFVRSLQDTFCRWCLHRSGQKWGRSSMSDAIACDRVSEDDPQWGKRWRTLGAYKPKHPAALLLGPAVPDYAMWFAWWRDVRNRAKSGTPANGSGAFIDGEFSLSVSIPEVRPDGGQLHGDFRDAVSLATVAEGLEMSTRVARVLSDPDGK